MAIKEVLEYLQQDENGERYRLSDLNISTITRWLANMSPVERAIANIFEYYENDRRYAAIVVDDFFDQKSSEGSFDSDIHFSTGKDLRDFLERAFDNTGSRVEFRQEKLVCADMSVFLFGDNGLIRMSDGESGVVIVEYCLDNVAVS